MKKKIINILHIEDDLIDRELISSTLVSEKFDFKIEYAKSYSQFTKALDPESTDIILADYSMPSFNGLHALEIVKSKGYKIPFIFVSGAIGEELAINCLKSGAADYILKDQLKKLAPSIKRALKEYEEIKKSEFIENELIETNKKLNKMVDEIIDTLSSFGEKKDPYTAGHQYRVSLVACEIAEKMKLDANTVKGLKTACLLHDVGKFYVPSEILNKPGKLTEYEFNIIKCHSQTGYDLLKGISFPWPVAEMVLQHHERLDGSGYPRGLKGREIMKEANILITADVIESMASDRPYRPALGLGAALGEIKRYRGTKFDAEVVDLCIRISKAKGFKYL